MKKTVYSPDSEFNNFRELTINFLNDLKPAHSLGLRLAKRNVKALYRQSFLGYFWSIFPPLATSLVWILLNSSNVINIESPGISYPLFVLIGTLLWQIFSESIQAPLKGVNSGKSMLSKINFPRESLLLAGIYETFFNAIIKIGLIIIILIFFQISPNFLSLFGLLGILSLIIFGSCIGILLTPIGMLYNDIQRALMVILQFALYLTPVIYPEPKLGIAEEMMRFNPVAPLLTTTRNMILDQPVAEIGSFSYLSIGALIMLFLGFIFYRISMPIIIERVGS